METKNTNRLLSLDALRGFDMFWIIGWGAIWSGLAALTNWPLFNWWAFQLTHPDWHGFRFYDLIFPLFLFIAGISFPFSLEKSLQKGISQKAINIKIVKRALMLVFLGFVSNGFLRLAFIKIGSDCEGGFLCFDFSAIRFAHVLGRIGLSWMFAAFIFMKIKKLSIRIAWCTGLLVFYWLLVALVPAFDNLGADRFSIEGNFVSYFDRMFLPGRFYRGEELHDPEGILATIPAIVTALLGMFTGQFVKWRKEGLTENKRTVYMAVAGLVLMVLGLLWDFVFPINKNLWTSSFVCLTGGMSLLLFALFYFIIDVKGYRKWTFFFSVIGMNSITIYMAQMIINFRFTTNYLFGGIISLFPETWTQFLNGVTLMTVCWLFLYFLYKQKIFLKV